MLHPLGTLFWPPSRGPRGLKIQARLTASKGNTVLSRFMS